MRLARDKVEGVSDCYNKYEMSELVSALKKYSPLVQIHSLQEVGVKAKRVGDQARNEWCRGGDLNSHALSNTTP